MWSDRLDPEAVDALEMTAVVGEEREVMLQGGGGDHGVETLDRISTPLQLSLDTAEDIARLDVDIEQGEVLNDVLQSRAGLLRLSYAVQANRQLRQREHAHRDALVSEFVDPYLDAERAVAQRSASITQFVSIRCRTGSLLPHHPIGEWARSRNLGGMRRRAWDLPRSTSPSCRTPAGGVGAPLQAAAAAKR